MSTTQKKETEGRARSIIAIRRHDWKEFLQSLTWRHNRRMVRIETHDLETNEDVVSQAAPLLGIELDLEELRNPRIKVTVSLGNKVMTYVLFQPSRLALELTNTGVDEALHVDTVNTLTTLRFEGGNSERK